MSDSLVDVLVMYNLRLALARTYLPKQQQAKAVLKLTLTFLSFIVATNGGLVLVFLHIHFNIVFIYH